MAVELPFDLPAADLARRGEELLRASTRRLEELEARPGPRSISATLAPLDQLLVDVYDLGSHGHLMFVTHPDARVRDAARGVGEAADRWFNAFRLRRGLYDALRAIPASELDPTTKHALEKLLREMRRSGVELDEKARASARALNDEIDRLSNQFQENVNRLVRTVRVRDRAELEGLPADYQSAHAPGPDGSITITTQYPDARPVLAYAERSELRRRVFLEFMNRASPENQRVLEKLLSKRFELAKLLGYRNFADFVIEDKMMGSTEAGWAFLERLRSLLSSSSAAHRAMLLERKRRDDPSATSLNGWDGGGFGASYYDVKLQNERFGVDKKLLRAYLPYVSVRDGLLRLCERLFDLQIERRPQEKSWHSSVEVFDVRHAGRPLGRFYLDLVPREGKFGHAAQFGINVGIEGRGLPRAALVCNFLDPSTPVESALMEYGDVITFFHEFGHLLHALFSGHGRWLYNSQGFVEWDFVEAPSQLFEEWARDPAILATMAKKPSTGEAIPSELLQRLKASESLGRGNSWLLQAALSSVSLSFYDRDPKGLDTTKLFREAFERFHPGVPPEGTHPAASFGHLTGYSAIYYTYAWSVVIARDLLSRFLEKGDLADPALAKRYVETILAPGSEKPAAALIEDFLGRPFSFDAFERWALADPFASTGPSGGSPATQP